VICFLEEYRLRYGGRGVVETAGFVKSRIADPQAVTASIHAAVQQAELDAKVAIDAVVVGIAGIGIEGTYNHGLYEFGRPRLVAQDDLAYAVDRASRVRLDAGRDLLHVFPQDFTLDGRSGYRNPRGVNCSRLEANVYIMSVPSHDHEGLIAATHEAHFAVEETVFEPVAAAYAAVMPEDRNRGVAIIDIGLQSTGFVVYDRDAVVAAKSLPISAEHFTRDVACGLTVSYEDAERLKLEYGSAMLGLTSDNSLIEVPSPEGRPPREAYRRVLNNILEARAEELFFAVKTELTRVGMEQSLLEGVVLIGGGSLLNGMCDMAERVLNCTARLGLPVGIQDWPEDLNNATWTTAAGLAMYSARLKMKREWKPKAPGLVGLILR
jgi:cell division protein FtsA